MLARYCLLQGARSKAVEVLGKGRGCLRSPLDEASDGCFEIEAGASAIFSREHSPASFTERLNIGCPDSMTERCAIRRPSRATSSKGWNLHEEFRSTMQSTLQGSCRVIWAFLTSSACPEPDVAHYCPCWRSAAAKRGCRQVLCGKSIASLPQVPERYFPSIYPFLVKIDGVHRRIRSYSDSSFMKSHCFVHLYTYICVEVRGSRYVCTY